jgi:hypothetical protein
MTAAPHFNGSAASHPPLQKTQGRATRPPVPRALLAQEGLFLRSSRDFKRVLRFVAIREFDVVCP